jgi:hypothetical protein
VRRLHLDAAPQTPDIRSARTGHPNSNGATSSKEDLKDRIISIVRNGADGSHYQALIQETCAWLKEQTAEEVSKSSRELIAVDDNFQALGSSSIISPSHPISSNA